MAAATPLHEQGNEPATEASTYILNTNTKRFHYPSCSSVDEMKDMNKQAYTGTRDELISEGYKPCGRCKP
jgi:DNA-entry nuclease